MAGAHSHERVSVLISFHDGLDYFLKPNQRLQQPIRRTVDCRTSVKDLIESCGIPHPEVDLILVDTRRVDFRFRIENDCITDVYPFSSLRASSGLQTRGIRSFVADGHLGKLVRDLRLLGIDVDYRNDADDRDLLAVMQREERALLTRDRLLLMHRVVQNGFFPKSQKPLEQTVETVRRFGLAPALAPFTRCLRCNGILKRTEKKAVIDQLEPLTQLYYDDFTKCPSCGQTYWRGSHMGKLETHVADILARVAIPKE
ncbi:MAG TPA: Mut7-C RNAse domain-containing protein [Chthoniobacterales bacterium]